MQVNEIIEREEAGMRSTVSSVEQRLLEAVAILPPAQAREVADFAEFLASRERNRAGSVHNALEDSFGVWRHRTDLPDDSARLVREMRDEWRQWEDDLDIQ